VESGSLAELRHLTRTSISAETVAPPAGLDALEGVHNLRVDDHRARFDVDTAHLGGALEQLTRLGVRTLVSQPPTLEELFLRHYGGRPE
jgi:ABC-2 type transport system ATP-binding protein